MIYIKRVVQNDRGILTEYAVEMIRNMTMSTDMADLLFSDGSLDLHFAIVNVFTDNVYRDNTSLKLNCVQIFFNVSNTNQNKLTTIPVLEKLTHLIREDNSLELKRRSLELLCNLLDHDENCILFSDLSIDCVSPLIGIISEINGRMEFMNLALKIVEHLSKIEDSRISITHPTLCLLQLMSTLIERDDVEHRRVALRIVENLYSAEEILSVIECAPLCLLRALVGVILNDPSNCRKPLVILANLSFTKLNRNVMMSSSFGLISELVRVLNDQKYTLRDKMDALVIISNFCRDDNNIAILSSSEYGIIKSLDQITRTISQDRRRGSQTNPQMLIISRIRAKLNITESEQRDEAKNMM